MMMRPLRFMCFSVAFVAMNTARTLMFSRRSISNVRVQRRRVSKASEGSAAKRGRPLERSVAGSFKLTPPPPWPQVIGWSFAEGRVFASWTPISNRARALPVRSTCASTAPAPPPRSSASRSGSVQRFQAGVEDRSPRRRKNTRFTETS